MRECMMWAQLRDNNQGIIKITSGGVAPGVNAKTPTVEFETPTGARVNGQQSMSMVVLHEAVELAIEKVCVRVCCAACRSVWRDRRTATLRRQRM